MTQEKLKRVVTAAAVAGTLVVVCLLAVILYQVIHNMDISFVCSAFPHIQSTTHSLRHLFSIRL